MKTEEFKDVEKYFPDFYEAIKERISNPYITSFIISWVITNFELVLTIFSKMDFLQKKGLLHVYFLVQPNWKLLYLPLLAMSAYVFLVPWLNVITGSYDQWLSLINGNLKRFITKPKVIDYTEYVKMRSNLLAYITDLSQQNDALQSNRVNFESFQKQNELKISDNSLSPEPEYAISEKITVSETLPIEPTDGKKSVDLLESVETKKDAESISDLSMLDREMQNAINISLQEKSNATKLLDILTPNEREVLEAMIKHVDSSDNESPYSSISDIGDEILEPRSVVEMVTNDLHKMGIIHKYDTGIAVLKPMGYRLGNMSRKLTRSAKSTAKK